MQKPLVFISHITTEKEIAIALKGLVEQAFLGMVHVSVSSDPNSIAMGGRWLNDITYGFKTCVNESYLPVFPRSPVPGSTLKQVRAGYVTFQLSRFAIPE